MIELIREICTTTIALIIAVYVYNVVIPKVARRLNRWQRNK